MGNQGNKTAQAATYRRRSLPNRNQREEANRSNYNTINQSLEVPKYEESRRYNSIDINEDAKSAPVQRNIDKKEVQQNRALQNLSKKNEQLRNQLKKISQQLSIQLKKKKLVPKKKTYDDDEQNNNIVPANAGIKRQLQNGYRQIQMYKRTIQSLKGKNQEHQSDLRVKRIENTITTVDSQIANFSHKIEAIKKVKKVQDIVISKDINDDLIGGVQALKRQSQTIKKQLKQLQKKQRQRDVNYKKQQAYLFQVQKKWREVNGQYFPELKTKKNQYINYGNNVNKNPQDSLPKDYDQVVEQLRILKQAHDGYHRKIDVALQAKNKVTQQVVSIQDNIRYSDKIIDALKQKLLQIKKISKPQRKSLFGYQNSDFLSSPSQKNGGIDQIQKQMQQQANQDQFDIKHLIANIPKPSRPKVVIDFKDDLKSPQTVPRQSSAQKGMVISGQKSQPKKWGSSMIRKQQKGRGVKKQVIFQENYVLPPEAKQYIVGINVWLNKNYNILGLQAIYLISGQIRYGTKSSNSDGFIQRYDLQNQDCLKNLTAAFSDEGYLQYLILYSKSGKIGTYGLKKEGQEMFTYGLAASERPFRIYGATFTYDGQPRINRLGVEICPDN